MCRLFAILCLIASTSLAAQGELKITGPSSAAVGSPIRLRLEGLPSVDMGKVMNEQLKWMDKVKIITDAPAGVKEGDYSLDQNLSVKVAPLQWTFNMEFQANKPGEYVLIVDWNQDAFELLHHRIIVGGGAAPNDPVVNPPVAPVTEKVARALILHENDLDTYQFQKLIQYLRANKEVGRLLLVLDKDAKNPDETINKIVQAAVQYVNGATLPRIIAVGVSGGFVKQAEMPKTEEDLDKLLKEWGLTK